MKNLYLLLFFTFINFQLSAQSLPASMVELNVSESSNPRSLTKFGSKIFFSAQSVSWGYELWIYDTITGKAKNLTTLGANTGIENSEFLVIGDILYFSLSDGISGFELWRSNGTEEGTYLVKEVNAVFLGGVSNISDFINYNNQLFFVANDEIHGKELWKSDGTEAGTMMVKDIFEGQDSSAPSNLFVFNNTLFFVAYDTNTNRELWASDGTEAGTYLFKDFSVGNGIFPQDFLVFNNNFYFFAKDLNLGTEIWKSDGTQAGTQILKDINSGDIITSNIIQGAAANNYFVFGAYTPNSGYELWKSDGTTAGTVLLKDINPGASGSISSPDFTVNNNIIYFVRTVANGEELWKTDGTTNGTVMVKQFITGNINDNIKNLTAANGYVYFGAKNIDGDSIITFNLWKTDGTEVGTIKLNDAPLYDNYLSILPLNDYIYYQAYTSRSGMELWKTDGTPANTKQEVEINHLTGSNPGYLTDIDGKLYFTAYNGINPYQIFISDGSIAGTKMANPIDTNTFMSEINPMFTKSGNYVFSKASNLTSGLELYKTDNIGNVTLVKDINPNASGLSPYGNFIDYNGILYFWAANTFENYELWRSDGTETGTYMVKEINPGDPTTGSFLYPKMAISNNYLYFNAFDGTENAIWRTDGTNAGTIKVLGTIDGYQNPVLTAVTDNKIFFTYENSNFNYTSMWSSDGTIQNKTMLGEWYNLIQIENTRTVFNNELYFVTVTENGYTVIKTDGTVEGTNVISDGHTLINGLTTTDTFVYFTLGEQYFGSANELWRTDGTPEGTINIVNNGSIMDYTTVGNYLYYLKMDLFDSQVWKTDGNINNTQQIDITLTNTDPLVEPEHFSAMKIAGNKLFLVAIKEKHGAELYIVEPNEDLGINNHLIENNNKRFSVSIYPNPTNSNSIYIKSNEGLNKIELYNINGQKVKEIENPSSSNSEYKIENMVQGFYLIKLTSDKESITKKVIVN